MREHFAEAVESSDCSRACEKRGAMSPTHGLAADARARSARPCALRRYRAGCRAAALVDEAGGADHGMLRRRDRKRDAAARIAARHLEHRAVARRAQHQLDRRASWPVSASSGRSDELRDLALRGDRDDVHAGFEPAVAGTRRDREERRRRRHLCDDRPLSVRKGRNHSERAGEDEHAGEPARARQRAATGVRSARRRLAIEPRHRDAEPAERQQDARSRGSPPPSAAPARLGSEPTVKAIARPKSEIIGQQVAAGDQAGRCRRRRAARGRRRSAGRDSVVTSKREQHERRSAMRLLQPPPSNHARRVEGHEAERGEHLHDVVDALP